MFNPFNLSDLQSINWNKPIANHPLNDDLVAWWMAVPNRNGWGTTTWKDLTGSYPGTLTNMDAATDWVAGGPVGGWGKLSFDGTDDYVGGIGAVGSFNAGTVAGWYRPLANDFFGDAVWSKGQNGGWRVVIGQVTSGHFRLYGVYQSGSSFTLDATASLNEWHHFVCSWEPNNQFLLFNGVVAGQSTSNYWGGGIETRNVELGRLYHFSDPRYAQTEIADIRMYEKAITIAQAKELYAQSQNNYPDLINRDFPLGGEVAGWKDGNLRDWIGTNDGTINGGVTTVVDRGKGGTKCWEFDGTGYIDSDSPVTDYPFTLIAFFMPTSAGGTKTIAGLSGSSAGRHWAYMAYYDIGSVSRLQAQLRVSGTTVVLSAADNSVSLNEWNHAALVCAGSGDYKLYLNGVQVATDSTSLALASIDKATIGGYYGNTLDTVEDLFTGSIDDARIFNRALLPAEIKALASRRNYQR